MTVEEAIAAADAILPGIATDDETDPRWQAVIAVLNSSRRIPLRRRRRNNARGPMTRRSKLVAFVIFRAFVISGWRG
jgi:hypothetical protein